MAEVPKHYFQKAFLAIGIMAVIYTMLTVKWIQDDYSLKNKIPTVARSFKSFKAFPDPTYLPRAEFLDTAGKPVKFSKYKGQYLIVNVWATWCQPCIAELPSLKKLSDVISVDGTWRVIAVSVDSKANLDKVAAFTEKTKTQDIANYYDYKNEVQTKLPLNGLPTTYIVSSSGRVVFEIQGGGFWHNQEVIDFLNDFKKVY